MKIVGQKNKKTCLFCFFGILDDSLRITLQKRFVEFCHIVDLLRSCAKGFFANLFYKINDNTHWEEAFYIGKQTKQNLNFFQICKTWKQIVKSASLAKKFDKKSGRSEKMNSKQKWNVFLLLSCLILDSESRIAIMSIVQDFINYS